MRVAPNSLADQRRALEMVHELRHDWQLQRERSELILRTGCESNRQPAGHSYNMQVAARWVAELEQQAARLLPADEARRREVERATLTDRVQTSLDLENVGDPTYFSDAWARAAAVRQRGDHAMRRAQARQRAATRSRHEQAPPAVVHGLDIQP